MKLFIVSLCMVLLTACSSVTVRTDEQKKVTREPDFQQNYDYWWWGLKGEYEVNVREICGANKVEQMQAISTFSDASLTLLTLGIYQPRSARVWCAE